MIRVALASLVLSACVAGNGSNTLPSGGGGGAPSELLGGWYAGAGGLSAPVDPDTGAVGQPNGSGLLYELRGDGTYTKAFQSFQSAGGCTTGFTITESGSYTFDLGTLVTTPSTGTKQYRDTCAPSLNSDGAEQGVVEQFSAQLLGDQLTLTRSDGATAQFRRIGS